ncbi:cytochrome c peroxidase [Sulfitobacter undariae]|uniref:Cytochrome c peroxidase n=1 Tax=Sulfitobacter undariae TaxID=1563671 RepID=A0A7W6H0X8_9RHOB|nr:cytochrome c peroxidase [Sulfitobacter undariae]MBB3994547.1 cytochrome c peroxidase [Sulfitobacter undariae]
MVKLSFGTLAAALLGFVPAMAGPLPAPVSDDDFNSFPPELVELGRDLFFDPILSGNKNIACATCHHPSMGTSDAMSLSFGEGGIGLGMGRRIDTANAPKERIPRNSPALFNLGAKEFTVMFHDGRTEKNRTAMYGIRMPAGRTLERPMPSALAAQNILPILSPSEMAGNAGENDVADAVAAERITGAGGAWGILARRVDDIPDYRQRFAALGTVGLHINDIGTALSAFISTELRATDSPFDKYLANDANALTETQLEGMDLFYGKARCSTCHSGPFQTDHNFHAIGMPQFGPGKAEYAVDKGRGMVTGEPEDMYRFRTPSLRNITQTAPYGHNGAYTDLEDMVRHHLNAVQGLAKYDRSNARLSNALTVDDWQATDNFDEVMRIAEAIEITDVALEQIEIDKIMSFLGALTDPDAGKRGLGAPVSVPSGLNMDTTSPPS